MNKLLNLISLIIITLAISACNKESNNTTLEQKSIIPAPYKISSETQYFKLKTNSRIVYNNPSLTNEAEFLSSLFKRSTGYEINTLESEKLHKHAIHLHIDTTKSAWQNEEYKLEIKKKQITLISNSSEGIFRGIQTLRQLLPVQIESSTAQHAEWIIPCGTIHDMPKYSYRGAMLDVSRHFFTINEVKTYIDQLALYKINHLHLHLTDDQGWRIEIKSWPKLTEIGGTSSVNNEKPGFYTQDEYKELVNYAASMHMIIVPEIDMPGHTNAALASYAELNQDGKATELYSGTEVGFSSFAIHKEITYQFVNDIIRELSAITPGPYIHIGGDESHATEHDDYVYFMNNVLDMVANNGKIAIGWDEMAHANISSNHIVQFWSNKSNTELALSKDAKVIFSPAKYAYLDMKYDSTTTLGLNWAGNVEIDKAYNWLPDTIIQNINLKQILGIEAPLWSETIQTNSDIEFMAFPRVCGIAEIGWSQNSALNWDKYKQRLIEHGKRFEILEIDFYKGKLVDWE